MTRAERLNVVVPSYGLSARIATQLSLVFLINACATSADVTPIGRGETMVEASLGGPLTEIKSTVIPLPGLVARGVHGIRESTDIAADVFLTPLLAYALLGVDLQIKEFVVEQPRGWVPAVGISAGFLNLVSLRPNVNRRPLVLPQIGTTVAWALGSGLGYLGGDGLWNTTKFTYFSTAPQFTWSYFAGYRYDLNRSWFFAGELKRFAANWHTGSLAADFYTINEDGLKQDYLQKGAVGIMVSAGRRL